MKKRPALLALAVIVLVGVLWLVYANRQYIKDYYTVSTTDIGAEEAALGKRITLTARADFIYQASQAQLQSAKQFRMSCGGLEKKNIVLGCYAGQRIYIYDVKERKLNGVREVTAAHELLHAVYARFSSSEKQQVNKLLQAQSQKITDNRIKDTLALYKDVSQADFYNEMYAIFGTELRSLSPALETHYEKYFLDRSKIVDYFNKYQQTFSELEEKRQQYDRQLRQLKSDIDALQTQANSGRRELDQLQAELNTLRSGDQITAYNQRVPIYNELVQSYNAGVANLRAKIGQYNELVETRNSIAVAENDLLDELNSSSQTID